MADTTLLTLVWAALLAFAVFMYVVMDGFDLGIGILFPVFGVGKERDTAMNSIAPVWDGNETWLVLGGGGLLAAFPLAYAIVMSAPDCDWIAAVTRACRSLRPMVSRLILIPRAFSASPSSCRRRSWSPAGTKSFHFSQWIWVVWA